MQERNERLLKNNAAIDGVLLVIEAAISSIGSSTQVAQFNSAKGLETKTVLSLIQGFHGALVSTIYAESAYQLAQTILMILSTKKILTFTATDKEILEKETLFFKQIQENVIKVAIEKTQTSITESGATIETTEADIVKLTFPVTVEEEEEDSTLTKVESLTLILKSMLANMDGLKLSLTAIETAVKSTSNTGVEERTILEVVAGIEAFSVALYGPDLKDTVIQNLASQLVKITLVSENKQISEESQVKQLLQIDLKIRRKKSI